MRRNLIEAVGHAIGSRINPPFREEKRKSFEQVGEAATAATIIFAASAVDAFAGGAPSEKGFDQQPLPVQMAYLQQSIREFMPEDALDPVGNLVTMQESELKDKVYVAPQNDQNGDRIHYLLFHRGKDNGQEIFDTSITLRKREDGAYHLDSIRTNIFSSLTTLGYFSKEIEAAGGQTQVLRKAFPGWVEANFSNPPKKFEDGYDYGSEALPTSMGESQQGKDMLYFELTTEGTFKFIVNPSKDETYLKN